MGMPRSRSLVSTVVWWMLRCSPTRASGRLVRVTAEVVEVDGVVELVGGEAASAHRDVVPVEDVADRPPFEAESRAELIYGCAGLVTGDEFLDLVDVELPCRPGLGRLTGGGARCGGVGQLPEQGLQRFYLCVCVVVSSPQGPQMNDQRNPCMPVDLLFVGSWGFTW